MKKIVAGLAALAMAASVFAVDVASMIQIDGDLMNYDGSDFKMIMAKDYDPSGSSDYVWKLSASGDKAGAEIWSWVKDLTTTTTTTTTLNDTDDPEDGIPDTATSSSTSTTSSILSQYSLWFKPFDWLKVTVGNIYASSAFNPQFGWWAKHTEYSKYGYQCDFTFDALTLRLALGEGKGNYWLDCSQSGFAMIGSFWFDVQYNLGSIGTVQAYVSKEVDNHPHGFNTFAYDCLVAGAAFGNNPYMQNGYYVELSAAFGASEYWKTEVYDFDKLLASVYGQYFVNGFGFQMINLAQLQKSGDAMKFRYGFEFKGTYALDSGWTPYVQINGYEIMDKKMEIDLGISGSVGSCTITTWAALPLEFASGYKFNFSVPVQFTVNL